MNDTLDDLRSTFIEFVGLMPIQYNNEHVLQAYERIFELMDALEQETN